MQTIIVVWIKADQYAFAKRLILFYCHLYIQLWYKHNHFNLTFYLFSVKEKVNKTKAKSYDPNELKDFRRQFSSGQVKMIKILLRM